MIQPDLCNLHLDFAGTVEIQVSGNAAAGVTVAVADMEIVGFLPEYNFVVVDAAAYLVAFLTVMKVATSVAEHSAAHVFVDFVLESAHIVDNFECMVG